LSNGRKYLKKESRGKKKLKRTLFNAHHKNLASAHSETDTFGAEKEIRNKNSRGTAAGTSRCYTRFRITASVINHAE